MQKLKVNDEVVVLAGKDKGKKGKVKSINLRKKVIVEGVKYWLKKQLSLLKKTQMVVLLIWKNHSHFLMLLLFLQKLEKQQE